MQTPAPRRERALFCAFLGVGVLWSYSFEVYDVRVPAARVALTVLSFVASFGLFWAGLLATKVPRCRRALSAAWAAVPWSSLLLSQLPYVGYFFLPIEVVASVMLLRRRSDLSYRAATLLATVTRALVFLLMMGAAAAMRASAWGYVDESRDARLYMAPSAWLNPRSKEKPLPHTAPSAWLNSAAAVQPLVSTGSGLCIEEIAVDEHSLYLQRSRGLITRLDQQPGAVPVVLRAYSREGSAFGLGLSQRNVYFDDGNGVARIAKSGGNMDRLSSVAGTGASLASDAQGAVWIEKAPEPSNAFRVLAIEDDIAQPRVLWSYDGAQENDVWVWERSLRVSGDTVTWIAEVPRLSPSDPAVRLTGIDSATIFMAPRRGGAVVTVYESQNPWDIVGDRLSARYVATASGAVLVVSRRDVQTKLLLVNEQRQEVTLATGAGDDALDLLAVDGNTVFWSSRDQPGLHRSELDGSRGPDVLASGSFNSLSRLGEPLLVSDGNDVIAVSADQVQRWPQQNATYTARTARHGQDAYLLDRHLHPHGGCLGSSVVRLVGERPL